MPPEPPCNLLGSWSKLHYELAQAEEELEFAKRRLSTEKTILASLKKALRGTSRRKRDPLVNAMTMVKTYIAAVAVAEAGVFFANQAILLAF